MSTTDKHRRIMGELVFLHGDIEAAAASAKLRAAGFEFVITDDIDECSDDTRYVMVWRDELDPTDAEDALNNFAAAIEATIGEVIDSAVIVAPDHVPVQFGDFGR